MMNDKETSTDLPSDPTTALSDASAGNDASPGSVRSSCSSTDQQGGAKNEPVPSLSKLFGLAKPEAKMLVFAFVLMIAAEATGLYNPLLVADAYDHLVDPALDPSERMSAISRVMILVLIVHGAGVVASFVRQSIMAVAGERVVARLRNDLYSSILKQEIAFFDEHKSGELVSRLGSDTTLIQQATSLAVPEVVLGVVKLVVSVALMFWISAKLAGVTLGFILVIFVICVPYGTWIGTLSKRYQNVLGEAQTHSTEALGGMRTVQSFASEDRERARFRNVIGEPGAYAWWWPSDHKTHQTTYSVGYFKSIAGMGFYTFIFGVGFGSMYASLWYGFKLVNTGEITLGELTAFQSYIFQIGGGLGQTSRFVTQLIEAQGASGRIFYLLERIPAIPKPGRSGATDTEGASELNHIDGDEEAPVAPRMPDSMTGAIEFNNVSFSYPSRPNVPVLRDFSLSITPNSTCALVGASGAGKSTIVALLQRFYEVTSGSVTVDGIDIRDLDLKWMRSHMGYVQQEPQLFGLTARENICYGVDRVVEMDELESVCRKANAYDFITSWPDQFDTLVGERGVKLSGGQKQRIAIARALLVNPRILLLDEATSALDSESEHLVQEAIEKAVQGRTVIIVAHRLSTIRRAQQIVVLDHHRLVDIGQHDDLLRRCSKYQELIKRQSVIAQSPGIVAEVLEEEDH